MSPLSPFFGLRWAIRVIVLVVLVVLAVPLVTATWIWSTGRKDDTSPADVVLVLGAAQFNGEPSPVLESRLMHAKELYDEGVAPTVMTLGGKQPGDEFTEAQAGKRWLVDAGVPAGDVVTVPVGEDTLESLRGAAESMAERDLATAVVVTDPDHTLRTRTMARDLGIDAWASPARYNTSRARSEKGLRYLSRETAAYLYYVAFQRRAVSAVL